MGGKPHNSHDLAEQAHRAGHHHRKRNKHKGRPCVNPPAAPTGVNVTFKVREKKTHLEFSMKIKWNGVFVDEQGHVIPGGGVEIDHYEGKVWATDAAGVPVEAEDGDTRVRRFHKKSVKGVKVTDAVIVSGTTAEFTTKRAHQFVVGERVRVQDIKPGAYNGRWTVLSAGLTATKFRADIGASPAQLENEGTVEGEPDPNYNFIFEHVPNPRRWYWRAKIRAWDNNNCPSDWSIVTQPALPIQEAEPQPPAPTFVSLTFDRKGGKKHNAFRGKVKFSPVTFWDIPGGDHEDDMAMYRIKIQSSEDGGSTWDKHKILHVRDSDDEKDEDASILVVFHGVRRRNLYRVWLASTSRYHQKGDYTGPFPSASGLGVGGAPGQVQNVVVTRPAPRRYKASWDEPTTPEDVDHYKIEWWRRNPLTLMETNRSRNRNDVYRVPEADKGKAHFPKVFAVDEDNNDSAFVQPGDQDETGDFGGIAPGTIAKHGGPNTPPGWLRCNGDSYPTATWPALFAEIGYTYGGSGANFNVPDFRRRHPRGVGTLQSLGENDGVIETERMDNHGDHQNHKHKHHHRNRRRDHSPHGLGNSDTTGGTPHSHNAGSLQTDTNPNTVARGTQSSLAAGPSHGHSVIGDTASGGFHGHQLRASDGLSPARDTSAPFVIGFGQTEHQQHEDTWVEPGASQSSVYQDSLVGGTRAADGQSWDGGPTDSFGNFTTIDEVGAQSGHKRHGHLRVHFIIKT